MSVGLFIKQFISFFISPIGIIFVLLFLSIVSFYKKQYHKVERYLLLALVSLFLFSYPPFANFLVSNLEDRYHKYDGKTSEVKYIHVLGNGHTTDATQPISSQISDDGTKRVLEGVILHKKMPDTTLIFTGYAGKTDTPNAVMNARLAYALGVEQNKTIIGEKPDDTYEEALFTQKIVGDEPFFLVTSASHMPRAILLFESLGMHPIAAPTAFRKDSTQALWLKAPSAHWFEVSSLALHEYVGILYTKLKNIVS